MPEDKSSKHVRETNSTILSIAAPLEKMQLARRTFELSMNLLRYDSVEDVIEPLNEEFKDFNSVEDMLKVCWKFVDKVYDINLFRVH